MELAALSSCRVSHAHAALTRAIGRGLTLPLRIVDDPADLILQLIEAKECQQEDGMTLSDDAGDMEFAQGRRFFRALTGIDYSVSADNDVDGDANAKRLLWLGSAILGRLGGTPFGVARGIATGTARLHDAVTLNLSLRSPQHAVSTFVRADANTWIRFLDRSRWSANGNAIVWLEHLPLRHPVRVATHCIDAHLLATVAEGDIVIPEKCAFDCAAIGEIRIGGLKLSVQYMNPNQLKVIIVEEIVGSDLDQHTDIDADEAPMESDALASMQTTSLQGMDHEPADAFQDDANNDSDDSHDMDKDSPDEVYHASDAEGDDDGAEDGNADDPDEVNDVDDIGGDIASGTYLPAGQDHNGRVVDACGDFPAAQLDSVSLTRIPVRLSFELGHLSLSVGQLARLGHGAILEIEGGSPAAIAIICSGQRIGSGEIVDVEGKLGIRITGWEKKC